MSGVVITTNLDENQLPIIIPHNFTFQAQAGETLVFDHVFKSFIANIEFPTNITFSNTTTTNITINISIPFFVNISTNPYSFNDTITITNNVNLNTTNITFVNSVLYNLTNISAQQNESNISISSESFFIRTFDILLPDTINQNITIVGKPNITVEITCVGQFITTCPPNFLPTDTQPQKTINIDILISNQTQVGNYMSLIIFRQDNSSKTVTFEIEVLKSTTIIRSITEIASLDKCFESPEEYAKCLTNRAKYEAQIAQKFLDELNKKGQCTNQTVEKIVVTGSVDEILFKDHQNIQEENRKLTEQLAQSSDNLLSCRSELGESQTKFGTETTFLREQSFKSSQDALSLIKLKQDELKNKSYKYVGIFLLIVFGTIGIYYSGKQMWWW